MKIGNIELLNCDNMAYMATVPDKHFDLAIVDPPYGINVNMQMGRKKNEKPRYEKKNWDKNIPDIEYFNELQRVSNNQIIWGGNYFAHLLPARMCWICWDKGVPEGVSFSDFELAWTSFDQAAVKLDIPYCGFIGLDSNKRIHPTEKPVRLYKNLLKMFAKDGFKILDTHLGSGSSAIASHDYKFEFVGLEIDSDYYEKTTKRFKNHVSQTVLF